MNIPTRAALLDFAHIVHRYTAEALHKPEPATLEDALAAAGDPDEWLNGIVTDLIATVRALEELRDARASIRCARHGVNEVVVAQGGFVVDVIRGVEAFDPAVKHWRARADRHRVDAHKHVGSAAAMFHLNKALQADAVADFLTTELEQRKQAGS